MREFLIILFGSLIGSAIALAAAWVYVRLICWLGRKVFSTWRRFLVLPILLPLALIRITPLFLPFYVLGIPAQNMDSALLALLFVFGLSGLLPATIFLHHHRRELQDAGVLTHRNA